MIFWKFRFNRIWNRFTAKLSTSEVAKKMAEEGGVKEARPHLWVYKCSCARTPHRPETCSSPSRVPKPNKVVLTTNHVTQSTTLTNQRPGLIHINQSATKGGRIMRYKSPNSSSGSKGHVIQTDQWRALQGAVLGCEDANKLTSGELAALLTQSATSHSATRVNRH